eukprot:snap_masked-scaffold_11-processed-gene-3.28-mRNA-1 protein AED:1.00 eAED:1.00 QI:0/-1/0/0/-1/1/1/0/84
MKVLFFAAFAYLTQLSHAQTMEGCVLCCSNMFQGKEESIEKCVSGCSKCESDDWTLVDCDGDDVCETGVRYMQFHKCYNVISHN